MTELFKGMASRLKGIFWHEGINGLGVRLPLVGVLPLPCRRRFHDAACRHDAGYDRKGGWRSRRYWDIEFLEDMIGVSDTTPQCCLAFGYFIAVRTLGWLFYRYQKD